MDNKKIPTWLGTILIVIFALTAAAFVWMAVKNQEILKQSQPTVVKSKLAETNQEQNNNQKNSQITVADSVSKNDAVLINRRSGIYEINLTTKELKLYDNPLMRLVDFSGLPKEIKNNRVSVTNGIRIMSQNKKKAIVVSITRDETKEPSGFDGSLPILKASEFICDAESKKCSSTDYLISAFKAVGKSGTWYGYSSIWWYNWDSVKNILYGHLDGEGVGKASPVYIYNINSNVLEKTSGYDSFDKSERRAEVPSGSFSPSLSKFVLVDENRSDNNMSNDWDLLLYNSNDLSRPFKKIDISSMNEKSNRQSRIASVAWSVDEKILVLETNKRIYALDLDSGQIDLRYVDAAMDYSGLWLDFNVVDLSQSGRYIVFVDYDTRDTPYGENRMNSVLKAIDTKDNNRVIEVFRETGITLNNRF